MSWEVYVQENEERDRKDHKDKDSKKHAHIVEVKALRIPSNRLYIQKHSESNLNIRAH